MKELIAKWKTFTEDQKKRIEAKAQDPDNFSWDFVTVGNYYSSELSYKLSENTLNRKYKIVDITIENLLNWIAEGENEFKGVEVKHEVKI